MTEKEKAKAYDEAIERAKKLYGNGITEEIFPELKESEDEKIRKEIISILRNAYWTSNRNRFNELVAWLEKQGDKDKTYSMSNKDNERLRNTTIAFLRDFAEQGYENAVECIDWLEKQDKMHLWTIQDAKDGDVLCCKSGWTCIFKAVDNHTNTFSSYCFMDSDKNFFSNGSEGHTLDKEFINAYNGLIHPATKEQCDTFMKVMNDAGYKWDAEKKELKKLVLKKLVKPKFDPKTLKPFDKVICKNGLDIWCCDFFSSYIENYVCKNVCVSRSYLYCIPYNDETKHLVGTTDEAPEYYKYWEE